MDEIRAAKIFAELLESARQGEQVPGILHDNASPDSAETTEMLQIATAAKNLPAPQPDSDWVHNARIRILNHAAKPAPGPGKSTALSLTFSQQLSLRLRKMFTAIALTTVFLVIGGLFSFVTQSALPGDLLYPAKLAMEDLQLVTAPDTKDAILKSQFAGNRLTEIQLLIVESRFEDVETAVAKFEEDVDQAVVSLAKVAMHDSSATYLVLLQVEKNISDYATHLSELRSLVPSETRLALEHAIMASQALTLQSDS